jgi:hydrogenase maturation protease
MENSWMKSRAPESSALIIGCGSTLRGDDALGCHAVVRLRELVTGSAQTLICHQLTPELAEPISRARLVVLIDARENCGPGTLVVDNVVAATALSQALNHHFDLPHLLELAERLYGRRPPAFAVSIGGESWGFSESLSPAVEAAMPALISRVMELVARQPVEEPGCTNCP